MALAVRVAGVDVRESLVEIPHKGLVRSVSLPIVDLESRVVSPLSVDVEPDTIGIPQLLSPRGD